MNFVSHLYLFCLKESQFSRVDLSGMAVSVLVKLCWFKKCPGDINWTLVMLGRHLWAQTKTLSLEYPQITGFLRCSGISCLLSGKSVWVWNFDSLLERSWSWNSLEQWSGIPRSHWWWQIRTFMGGRYDRWWFLFLGGPTLLLWINFFLCHSFFQNQRKKAICFSCEISLVLEILTGNFNYHLPFQSLGEKCDLDEQWQVSGKPRPLWCTGYYSLLLKRWTVCGKPGQSVRTLAGNRVCRLKQRCLCLVLNPTFGLNGWEKKKLAFLFIHWFSSLSFVQVRTFHSPQPWRAQCFIFPCHSLSPETPAISKAFPTK